MTISSITSNTTAPRDPVSVQPTNAEAAKFAKLMAEEPAAGAVESGADSSSATTDEQLWAAVNQGFTDAIIRSGIRRTVNHINEMKRLYRDEM
jgi:hypothetical protein